MDSQGRAPAALREYSETEDLVPLHLNPRLAESSGLTAALTSSKETGRAEPNRPLRRLMLEMPFAACEPCKCLLFHEGAVDGVACPHCNRQVSPLGIEEARRRLRRARARRQRRSAPSPAADGGDGVME